MSDFQQDHTKKLPQIKVRNSRTDTRSKQNTKTTRKENSHSTSFKTLNRAKKDQ